MALEPGYLLADCLLDLSAAGSVLCCAGHFLMIASGCNVVDPTSGFGLVDS